jgi:hypothetical protein
MVGSIRYFGFSYTGPRGSLDEKGLEYRGQAYLTGWDKFHTDTKIARTQSN